MVAVVAFLSHAWFCLFIVLHLFSFIRLAQVIVGLGVGSSLVLIHISPISRLIPLDVMMCVPIRLCSVPSLNSGMN